MEIDRIKITIRRNIREIYSQFSFELQILRDTPEEFVANQTQHHINRDYPGWYLSSITRFTVK